MNYESVQFFTFIHTKMYKTKYQLKIWYQKNLLLFPVLRFNVSPCKIHSQYKSVNECIRRDTNENFLETMQITDLITFRRKLQNRGAIFSPPKGKKTFYITEVQKYVFRTVKSPRGVVNFAHIYNTTHRCNLIYPKLCRFRIENFPFAPCLLPFVAFPRYVRE